MDTLSKICQVLTEYGARCCQIKVLIGLFALLIAQSQNLQSAIRKVSIFWQYKVMLCAWWMGFITIHGIREERFRFTFGINKQGGIQRMTIKEVFDVINEYSNISAIIVLVIASMLEISKIQINPWSWLGRVINKDVIKKVDKIEKNLVDVERKVGESTAVNARYRILRFDAIDNFDFEINEYVVFKHNYVLYPNDYYFIKHSTKSGILCRLIHNDILFHMMSCDKEKVSMFFNTLRNL